MTVYRLCVTEKTAQQQRQFETVFLELSQKMPYDDITISELCRQSGLSRKIFYRLFDRKADVLYALLDHTLLDAQNFQPDPSVKEGGLHRFFAFWKSQKPLLDMLRDNQCSSALTEAAIRHIARNGFEYLYCFGTAESPYPTESLNFYVSGIFSLVLNWHSHGYDKSIDELSDCLMYLLTSTPVKHPLTGPGE